MLESDENWKHKRKKYKGWSVQRAKKRRLWNRKKTALRKSKEKESDMKSGSWYRYLKLEDGNFPH